MQVWFLVLLSLLNCEVMLTVGIGFAVRGGDGWFYLLPKFVGTQTVTDFMA
jgi:hypothetical protein